MNPNQEMVHFRYENAYYVALKDSDNERGSLNCEEESVDLQQ